MFIVVIKLDWKCYIPDTMATAVALNASKIIMAVIDVFKMHTPTFIPIWQGPTLDWENWEINIYTMMFVMSTLFHGRCNFSSRTYLIGLLCPLLLTWFNFNPSMDK